jgi:hypothetical protein
MQRSICLELCEKRTNAIGNRKHRLNAQILRCTFVLPMQLNWLALARDLASNLNFQL